MTRVLIAEDETLIRLDLRAQLEDAGYVVCAEAADGVEAVRLAAAELPDVVVLDVKMPHLDGIDAARAILSGRRVPIVIVTAYEHERQIRRAADVGAFSYLTKPYTPGDLLSAIELALARHRELEEVREESATLADALAARKVIERAKALLMEREELTEGEAFARLRRASQRSGQPLDVIAQAVVAAIGDGAPPSEGSATMGGAGLEPATPSL